MGANPGTFFRAGPAIQHGAATAAGPGAEPTAAGSVAASQTTCYRQQDEKTEDRAGPASVPAAVLYHRDHGTYSVVGGEVRPRRYSPGRATERTGDGHFGLLNTGLVPAAI